MTLRVGDFSRYNGPSPDYTGLDRVILNCTPQNIYFRAQYDKADSEGLGVDFYSWPLAFGPTGTIDGAQCVASLQGLKPGAVFYDIESGSFTGDPVSLSLDWVRAVQAGGRGAHLYVQGGLIAQYDFTPLVQAGAGLWVAQYSGALTVPLGAWSSVGPLGWQYTSTPYDQSNFYLDAAGWAAISVPPPIDPQSSNVTPIGDDVSYSQWSDTDKAALLKDVYNAVWNGGSGFPLIQNYRLGRGEWPATLIGANEQRIQNEILPAALAGIKATVDPATLAAAIPADIAAEVAVELGKRLQATPPAA